MSSVAFINDRSSSVTAITCLHGHKSAAGNAVLNLIRAKCLPVLLYGVESCPLMVRDKKSLGVHGYSLTYEVV